MRRDDGPLTSLVFPAYNPGAEAERAWRQVADFLAAATDPWEVLFVCDGCTDGTPARLTELTRGHGARVRVLSHAPNRGKGYAVRRGLLAARGRWRLFADIDLAYGLDDVLRVAAALRAGADVAIASRTHPDSRAVLPPGLEGYVYRRRLQSALFSFLARLLLPVQQRDTQAGLKGLSARAAGLLLPRLRCRGFGFDCELLTACARLGLPVVEVPVCVRYRDGDSTAGLRGAASAVADLWRIRRAWRAAS